MLKTIIKRDGSTEEFDPSKLNRWAQWASEQTGIDIEWSEMVLDTVGSIKSETIGSQELQKALIDRLIAEDTFSSLKMAGMLFGPLLQKKIYPQGIPTVQQLHNKLVNNGLMQAMGYSDTDYEQIQTFIDHTRDFNSQYIELDYTNHKYALKDVKTKQVFETMQFVYMRMAMRISEMENLDVRLHYVKDYYDYLSNKKISFPTPDFNNLGTPLNGYASCCVTKTGDDRFSLAVNEHILNVMTTQSAGIGTYVQTRSIGDDIKNGKMIHRGRIPYLRTIQSIVHENTQGSRGGAATAYYDCFDPEVERIQLLKHPLTSPEERVDGINYAMNYNKFFARKVALNEDFMLFNVYNAPDLVKAFYSSNAGLFERLYNKYENDPGFIKKYKKAREIFVNASTQSFETGVHFECNIQEMNTHTPFKDTIHSSNLCMEIGLSTEEYKSMQDMYSSTDVSKVVVKVMQECSVVDLVLTYGGNEFITVLRDDNPVKTYGSDLQIGDKLSGPKGSGTITEIIENYNPEIGLCSLGGVVISNIKSPEEYKKACFLLLRKIDRTIHMSDYPLPHLEVTAKARMSAGVGIMGLATVLAKEKVSISTKQGKQRLHEIFENHAYCLIESSLELSKEFGVAPWMHRTKWVDGWTPMATYNKNVDKIQDFEYRFDWQDLSNRIKANGGIRNTVTTAFMPGESSSKAAGVTNSINFIKGKNLDKSDEEKTSPFSAPYSDNPEYVYEIAYDIPSKDIDEMYAIAQKFTDQTISADHYKKLNKGATVTTEEMIEGFLNRVKLGHKTKYYQNSLISDGIELAITRDCQDGVCTL
jgi:ribonucleoside-diphosphate reductase alpha chain